TAEAGGKNRILTGEVLVQRRAADTCAHDDVAYRDVLIRTLEDQRKEGLEQCLTGFLHTPVARGPNVADVAGQVSGYGADHVGIVGESATGEHRARERPRGGP